MSDTIDTTGIDRAQLLAGLFNAALPGQSLARLIGNVHDEMTATEAQELLDAGKTYVDYLKGRVIKCDVTEAHIRPHLYDRDNGEGAAARVVSNLRRPQP